MARNRPVVLLALACLAPLAPLPAAALQFRLPVADPAALWADFLVHVDHDPEAYGDGDIHCLAYDGRQDFPFCYDQHDGTDFMLDGGFPAMDAGSVAVVAAADGQVTRTVDGNYDRCHAELGLQTVTCDGYPIRANWVEVTHGDGTVTWYYHLMKGSVAVTEGQFVACGDVLGRVGSSGVSSMPHLHFEVHDADGNVVDPYAGVHSQPGSWWVVEDAGNGLPGPWCEGEPIPPEPEPEPQPEPLPERVEPVPEPAPDVLEDRGAGTGDLPADGGADGAGEDGAGPDEAPADPGTPGDGIGEDAAGPEGTTGDAAGPGADPDAGGGTDLRGILGGAGGFCHAGASPAAGPGAAWLLALAGLAWRAARRRRPAAGNR